jgi:hypothetical protein
MKEMQALQGMDMNMFPDSHNVVINYKPSACGRKIIENEERR